ncbi:MAG: HEAT repeat domain-containing protein [Nitrospirae bacterium]|nr:HEAT repeat domain-containing protein [Nitrospirota bacterium]
MHKAKISGLIKNLGHPDASRRRAAAEALAEGDERAVYPLIRALRDDNYGVQDAAINSLKRIKQEITAYMVLPLLREEAFLRNTALMILREMGQIAVPLLPVLLKDKDDDIRKFAVDIIHDVQYCDYPEKLIEMLTGDPNPNVRAAAAKTLGALNYREAVPHLVAALNDEEWVRFSVLEALTVLRDEGSVDSIVALMNNPSEAIRLAAVEVLGKIGSSKARDHLMGHFSKAEGFEKRATLTSLVQLETVPSSPGTFDDLVAMLRGGDWEDRFIAIKGLLLLGDERAVFHMIDVAGSIDFSSPDRDEKIQAVREAVSSFGCNDTLIKIIEDDSVKYRGKSLAVEIAGDLKCTSAVPSLIKLIRSEFRDLRRSSAQSLGQIDGEEAREHLIEAIRDHDSHVRKSSVIALGKLCEMSAFEPLMRLLHKEVYYDVIEEIIHALLHINTTLLLSRIGELDERIRETAARHASSFNSGVSC